jgi:hypothetical protein
MSKNEHTPDSVSERVRGEITDIPSGTGYVDLTSKYYTVYALAADRSIVAWGDDDYGEISEVPGGTGYLDIAAVGYGAVAIASDGSLVAWGYDGYNVTTNVPSGNDFVQVAGTDQDVCALRADGSIVTWGYDEYNEGDIPTGTGYTAVYGGYYSGYVSLGSAASVPVPVNSVWSLLLLILLLGGVAVYGLRRVSKFGQDT